MRRIAVERAMDAAKSLGEKSNEQTYAMRRAYRSQISWLALNEGGDRLLDADGSLDRIRAAVGKADPSFVEPIQHPHARTRVLHSLRAEQVPPGFTGHNCSSHRRPESRRKGGGQVVGRHSARTFQL